MQENLEIETVELVAFLLSGGGVPGQSQFYLLALPWLERLLMR